MMREPLDSFSTLDDVLRSVREAKRIIVVTGAGISVSCGIPDFRSPSVGLYNSSRYLDYGIPSPELLFDLEFFKIDPEPFYRFASALVPDDSIKPSKTHEFIALLERKKKLLNVYTQNIDGLEYSAGCKRVVQVHGSMQSFRCLQCRKQALLEECIASFRCDLPTVPHCRRCTKGVMKPNITFFGEVGPPGVSKSMNKDCQKCDLVLVIGTSLKVQGAALQLLSLVPSTTPRVLINNEVVRIRQTLGSPYSSPSVKSKGGFPSPSGGSNVNASNSGFDVLLLGKSDNVVELLCEHLGWTQDLMEAVNGKSPLDVKHPDHSGTQKLNSIEKQNKNSGKTEVSAVKIVKNGIPPPIKPAMDDVKILDNKFDVITLPLKIDISNITSNYEPNLLLADCPENKSLSDRVKFKFKLSSSTERIYTLCEETIEDEVLGDGAVSQNIAIGYKNKRKINPVSVNVSKGLKKRKITSKFHAEGTSSVNSCLPSSIKSKPSHKNKLHVRSISKPLVQCRMNLRPKKM